MVRKTTRKVTRADSSSVSRVTFNPKLARRSFLKLSAATAALSGSFLTSRLIRPVSAVSTVKSPYEGSERIRTICSYCAVGCGIMAEVQNGVWVRQEVAQDHPVSRGAHCCKGAGAIEMVTGEKRLKNPMKRVNGKWKNLQWDQALEEITSKLLTIRKKHGPDALHFNGSAKVSNEMAYLQRKFAAFWGSNNIDHQARI